MYCYTGTCGTLGPYKYVVVLSEYQGKLLFSRRCDRTTWETQGGHIEPGETPEEAAHRELWEESGAVSYTLTAGFDYRAGDDDGSAGGMVFFAHIDILGPLPASEMAEVRTFDALPEDSMLTYPGITPVLYRYAKEKCGRYQAIAE